MRHLLSGTCVFVLLCGCAAPPREEASFSRFAEEYVYRTLAESPVTATQVGYHKHDGRELDTELDDLSAQAIERNREWLRDLRLRMARSLDVEKLDPQDRADYDIVSDAISLNLLEYDTIQNYRHNPTLYVEMIGNALFAPFTLEYADANTRFRHIIARLDKVPRLLEQARGNLVSAPEVWTRTAMAENDGNVGLIDSEIRKSVPVDMRAAYDAAAASALRAIREFNVWLERDLMRKPYDWRLGSEKYGQKFRAVLATDQSPQQVLASAEAEMKRVREQMLGIARSLGATGGNLNETVRAALDKIATQHATPETYFNDARRDLAETTAFVREKDLLTLPPRDNLQVIETPAFMRGIYAVGGFNPAPALQPELGAFYWLTPFTLDMPKASVESKLREYNLYGLKLLTIHEAMPGHYVQLEYANDIQPQLRRIIRGVFGNGPYVEGWAVYATEMMLDQGYLNNSPELRLTFLKQQLRMIANTILDVRLQTMGMTDQQAMDLMLKEGFQEREEATAKLRRAKLSSTQLPTYFVGWRDWHRLREQYQEMKGADFSLKEFHESTLRAGALPLPVLARLLTGKALEPVHQSSERSAAVAH